MWQWWRVPTETVRWTIRVEREDRGEWIHCEVSRTIRNTILNGGTKHSTEEHW